jgi:hypothetical protein
VVTNTGESAVMFLRLQVVLMSIGMIVKSIIYETLNIRALTSRTPFDGFGLERVKVMLLYLWFSGSVRGS